MGFSIKLVEWNNIHIKLIKRNQFDFTWRSQKMSNKSSETFSNGERKWENFIKALSNVMFLMTFLGLWRYWFDMQTTKIWIIGQVTFIKNSRESFMKKLSKGKFENRQCNYNDIPQYKVQMQKNTVYQIVWKLET